MSKVQKHKQVDCPYLHVKKCKGCGRSCGCYDGSIERRVATKRANHVLDQLKQLEFVEGRDSIRSRKNAKGDIVSDAINFRDGKYHLLVVVKTIVKRKQRG